MLALQKVLIVVLLLSALLALAPASEAQYGRPERSSVLQPEAEELMARANEARAAMGAGRLLWDPALAAAAKVHCLRMAAEGPIAHQYPGELGLAERTGQAGAHFSLVEENVAFGPDTATIHDSWMRSRGHRENLMNPEVDRVGIAVVASRGELYAVADYARSVQTLSAAQIEARIAALIRVSGVGVLADPTLARAACAMDHGLPASRANGPQPMFVMRWQGADLSTLPQPLVERLSSGHYRQASAGSCAPAGDSGSFSAYRLAVLLY